jgi:hypothetical protein
MTGVNYVRISQTFLLGILCVLLTSVGIVVAQDVKTDYDHTANFSKYRTFMWIREPKPQNPLMKDRIVEAINAQLEARGLEEVTSGADLGVSANVATQGRHTLQSFYDDFPGWRWHHMWGPGYVTTTVDTYRVGALVVDLFDTRSKQVVWWGSAVDTVSDKPEKNTKKLEKSAEKIFKDFPPRGAPKTTR